MYLSKWHFYLKALIYQSREECEPWEKGGVRIFTHSSSIPGARPISQRLECFSAWTYPWKGIISTWCKRLSWVWSWSKGKMKQCINDAYTIHSYQASCTLTKPDEMITVQALFCTHTEAVKPALSNPRLNFDQSNAFDLLNCPIRRLHLITWFNFNWFYLQVITGVLGIFQTDQFWPNSTESRFYLQFDQVCWYCSLKVGYLVSRFDCSARNQPAAILIFGWSQQNILSAKWWHSRYHWLISTSCG